MVHVYIFTVTIPTQHLDSKMTLNTPADSHSAIETTPKVEIYSSAYCGYSNMALRLLDSKAIEYQIHSVDSAAQLRGEMQARSGRTSVPQIFIGEAHIGGCDELYALEQRGQLDALLTGQS
jgi:glutaredoxin 3